MSRDTGGDRDWVPAYAVVRYDNFKADVATSPLDCFTVKSILPSEEEALEEVARLNALVKPVDVTYACQHTRYYAGRR